jgi:hypothetical protein
MLRRAFLALVFAATIREVQAESPPAPKAFNLTVGGGFGPKYEVKMLDSKLYYSKSDRRYGDRDYKVVRSATFKPTAKQWADFHGVLDQLRAWDWQPTYEPPIGGTDGTLWKLQIIYPDRKIVSEGDNKYPGSDGANGGYDRKPTPTFQAFLDAVKSLVGGLPIE